MKTLLKISITLIFTASLFAQTVVAPPDPPEPRSFYYVGGDLTEEQEQEHLSRIKNEQLKKELMEIKKLDKKKYYRILSKSSLLSFPSIYSFGGDGDYQIVSEREVSELRTKISELEMYSEVLSVKYASANQTDKQKLANKLHDILGQVFDLRESQREEEVAKLEKKIAELKESIKIRGDNKQQIVEDRFRTLTGKGKYLKWD